MSLRADLPQSKTSAYQRRIRGHWLFSGFPIDFQEDISRSFAIQTYPSGSILLSQNDPSEHWYILLEGSISVQKDGEEIAKIKENEAFGELGFLNNLPRTSSCVVEQDSIIASLDQDQYRRLLKKQPDLKQEVSRLSEFRVSLKEWDAEHSPETYYQGEGEVYLQDIEFLTQLNLAAGGASQLRHSKEVGLLAQSMAEVLNPKLSNRVLAAGYLHEIGKICLPKHLVKKQQRGAILTEDEQYIFSQHFSVAKDLLQDTRGTSKILGFIEQLCFSDIKQLSIEAQILKLADAYLELTDQAYQAQSHGHAIEHLRKEVDTTYHPAVFKALQLKSAGFILSQTDRLLESAESILKIQAQQGSHLYRHALKVQHIAVQFAHYLQLPNRDIRILSIASFYNDIGNMFLDTDIVHLPRKLTPEEFEQVKEHPLKSEQMLSQFPGIIGVREVVRHHHENWDGSGYPDQLSELDIPPLARIMRIVDVWVALTSNRIYRKNTYGRPYAFHPVEALDFLEDRSGTLFDARHLSVFKDFILEQYPEITKSQEIKSP